MLSLIMISIFSLIMTWTFNWWLGQPHTTLTHWGRVTHICVGKWTIIGSDNGLSPGRRQAIIWTNAGILLIRPLGTNFSEISIKIPSFSFTKMRLKMSSATWRPFCLGLNVLNGLRTILSFHICVKSHPPHVTHVHVSQIIIDLFHNNFSPSG